MPKLWVLSDLHLEAVPHPEAYRPRCRGFDVLVAAGDVQHGSARAVATVARLAAGRPAVFVLGNHEPWHRELGAEQAAARHAATQHGVTLLDDAETTLAGVRFVGGTLWADGRLGGQDATPGQITGELVHVAHDGGGTRLLTNGNHAALHARTCGVIEAALAGPGEGCPVVVVTHHAPHPLCVPASLRGHWVAGNSASDLSHLTDSGQVALWVHGHLHESVDLVRPGGTRLLCNPAGPRFGNAAFRDDLVGPVTAKLCDLAIWSWRQGCCMESGPGRRRSVRPWRR